ncbi:hypothetical protein AX15_001078 [Amanita polypyramis BW_CC]|nr:hypothetical protein AX15_001078 [Amanita polypyramis BW_CC]
MALLADQTAPILDLPANILALCFNLLDVKDVLNCRKVCSAFLSVVDADVQLRYNIELYASYMVNGPVGVVHLDSPLPSLLEHKRRWQECEWTTIKSLPFPVLTNSDGSETNEAAILTRGQLCCAFLFLGSYFRFFQLPSHVRGLRYHEWDVKLPERLNKTCEIDFDPSQDILILLEFPENNRRDVQLSVRGLKDGFLHPLASKLCLATYPCDGTDMKIRLFGPYVTLFMKAQPIFNLECRLDIYNWKAGNRINTLWRRSVEAIIVISKRYMLLVELISFVSPLKLWIADIHDEAKPFVCCLILPNMPRKGAYRRPTYHINIQCGPHSPPPTSALHNSSAFFATDAVQQLVLVTFALYECEAFGLFTLVSRLEKLAERYRGNPEPSIVPWEEWGPENTRIVDIPLRAGENLCVYGTKAIIVDKDTRVLYDFNQRSINRELSRSASDGSPEGIVATATELVERSTFSDTVTTCLPYRFTNFTLEGFDSMTEPVVHMGEDGVVCVPGEYEQHIVISSI